MPLPTARITSLLLMLVALPLLSLGTTNALSPIWWAGLASLTLGALIPTALRFAPAPAPQQPERPRPETPARNHASADPAMS